MKKLLILLLLISATLLLVSCGADDSDESTPTGKTIKLNVYNWGEYISDGFEGSLDVNSAFEEYCRNELNLNVEVVYSTYPTNEDMYYKLQNNAGNYDVIFPSDYMLEKMIENDMLLKFNVEEEIENFKYIDPKFKSNYYDQNNEYSVAYTYGMTGIIYNTTMVDDEDIKKQSWGLLWNEKYAGKILQFNNPRDAFGSAMYWQNIDINSTDKADWDLALGYLSDQKPIVQSYVNDEIFNKMTSGSAAIAPYFAGDFITMVDQNENLDFYYPVEGSNVFVDAMCIPKNANNPELAKEYINFMLTREVAVANAIYVGYASPNTQVYNAETGEFDEEYAEEMGEYALEILYGTNDKTSYKYSPYYRSFSPEMELYVNTLWESLKTENSTELWVHITSLVIVVGVLGMATYSVYIKKKRSRDYRLRDKKIRLERKNANKT